MNAAVIVQAVRTPIGRRGGALSEIRADDLLAAVLQEVVARAGIDPGAVEDVIAGCVTQVGEQGANVARTAALLAGFPVEVAAVSVNRQCGSSHQAIHFAAQAIESGDAGVVIAAGVESMSRVKLGADYGEWNPRLLERYRLVHQGVAAEMLVRRYGLTREECDRYSLESHRRAAQATDEGRFHREILPVAGKDGVTVTADEGIRRDTSLEKLAALQPAFDPQGVITAGNSSQISDGAAALLLMSERRAQELGCRPRARLVSRAVVGSDPVIMFTGVVPATRRALARAGMRLDDMDVVEISEAFAPVVLAWAADLEPEMTRVNPNGGAIALGHPVGASGARLATTLLHELERRGGRYGLQVVCIGWGMATATVIERL
ncbi:MAG: thiolase family protein [Armatimonadota bacterium]|nr:thiolase family protein [Armatimonadota bacterium]MDR7450825.1 thiolase family protein [Armatimonadota bacterium]MDR7465746.1 thiolase family protein [Armatimonadota bacterium]MDR7493654.1 thiolase family protein [Armatimonadota bacterium]MDR7499097.1 thiolase family protein [Armatimonadota bacterium]